MMRLFGPDCFPAPVDAATLGTLPAGIRWIDLLNPTPHEEKMAEAALGQNIPTREELAEIEPSSRLYERGGTLFMTASILDASAPGRPQADPIGFILSGTLLVTIRYSDPEPFVLFSEHLYSEPDLAEDALSILVRLLDTIVDELADEFEKAGVEIEKLSSLIFERHLKRREKESRTERRLEALLLRVGSVQRLLAEIREAAVSTARLLSFFRGSEPVTGKHERHVASLQADVKALLDHSAFLNENLAFLLDATLGLINLEQNSVMKIFSVFAVVFMPPTLIAGIYGMNFEHMPELDWLYGYPVALGLILASAVLPYWFAKRSGWL